MSEGDAGVINATKHGTMIGQRKRAKSTCPSFPLLSVTCQGWSGRGTMWQTQRDASDGRGAEH